MVGVVVPVNDEDEFRRNPLGSPGLQGYSIVPVHGAASAADAWAKGLELCDNPWIIFCHQDVWFPEGAGQAIEDVLRKVPLKDERNTVLGVIGLGWAAGVPFSSGLVEDRGRLLDWPESSHAVSLDELCVIMHRSCRYAIDARLGWHLWATDLCIQASRDGHPARIIRVLLHHNSTLSSIPAEFYRSADILHAKYPGQALHTLNGFL